VPYQHPESLPAGPQRWRVSWQRPQYWLCELVDDEGHVTSWLFDGVRLEGVLAVTETRAEPHPAAWIWAFGCLIVSGQAHEDAYFQAVVGGTATVAPVTQAGRKEAARGEG